VDDTHSQKSALLMCNVAFPARDRMWLVIMSAWLASPPAPRRPHSEKFGAGSPVVPSFAWRLSVVWLNSYLSHPLPRVVSAAGRHRSRRPPGANHRGALAIPGRLLREFVTTTG
jgi:hypothetical protein